MTLSLTVPPEVEAKLRERAAKCGQSVDAYAVRVLSDAVTGPDVDAILAPFRKQIAESGMSDEELEAYYESLRQEAWEEKQGRRE